MADTQYDGRDFPATHGTPGEGHPFLATSWLADWGAIGGGVSIARDGSVNPWRFADVQQDADFTEGALLFDLANTPGLARAVRVVIGSRAGLMIVRAMEVMKHG